MAASAARFRPTEARLPRQMRRGPGSIGRTALSVLLLIAVAAVVGPEVWPRDALEQAPAARLGPPSLLHPLGTDQFGRDIFARLLVGARWSLLGAIVVCTGTTILGFAIGALAAISSSFTDAALGRLIEALMAVPSIVTALACTAVLGPSFQNLLLALIMTGWPWYARTYRSLILKERAAPYVEAALALGASRWSAVVRHILPNISGPAVVVATTNVGAVILSLASLSFLGLGMQPPTPEWGMMINEGRPYFQRYPWQMLAPGLCITLTVLAINLAGDALQALLDPRTARSPR
jgi:ABC-type dipeptide/oligopeptide/nickel transport system permease subunit